MSLNNLLDLLKCKSRWKSINKNTAYIQIRQLRMSLESVQQMIRKLQETNQKQQNFLKKLFEEKIMKIGVIHENQYFDEMFMYMFADQINKPICKADESFILNGDVYTYTPRKTFKTFCELTTEYGNYYRFNRDLKSFMTTFREKCKQKHIPYEYPEIKCSKQIIVQSICTREYVIGQKAIKGKAIKYNNNFGYINESLSTTNQLIQAFSLYTYYISNFQYMINNISAVGNQITEFAINFSESFKLFMESNNETDLGMDGISEHMIGLEGKKHLYQQIFKIMDIDLE